MNISAAVFAHLFRMTAMPIVMVATGVHILAVASGMILERRGHTALLLLLYYITLLCHSVLIGLIILGTTIYLFL
jgi:hypothetical protein